MGTDLTQISHLALLAGAVSLVPFFILMTTSFVKIAVVLPLVRNALGIQQIPPNMALYGLALILTLYIMAPVFSQMAEIAETRSFASVSEVFDSISVIAEPLRVFLLEHTDELEHDFFINTVEKIWPQHLVDSIDRESFATLIPAFMITELTAAFEIGFLLYLPFIAIDLIVSNLLLAMGMMMVSPLTISLPLKLFLFVVVDGWSQLIRGLVFTY